MDWGCEVVSREQEKRSCVEGRKTKAERQLTGQARRQPARRESLEASNPHLRLHTHRVAGQGLRGA